jgi:hypothetical protein
MWVQHGVIWPDDGTHSDEQVGNAASVRFANPELPGRLLTVYAFGEMGESGEIDLKTMTEFMICRDLDDPGSTEEWCDYQYEELDHRPLKGVADAQSVALGWVKSFDANRDIHWDGEPF